MVLYSQDAIRSPQYSAMPRQWCCAWAALPSSASPQADAQSSPKVCGFWLQIQCKAIGQGIWFVKKWVYTAFSLCLLEGFSHPAPGYSGNESVFGEESCVLCVVSGFREFWILCNLDFFYCWINQEFRVETGISVHKFVTLWGGGGYDIKATNWQWLLLSSSERIFHSRVQILSCCSGECVTKWL